VLGFRTPANRSGQAYGLALLTAIRPGEELALRQELRGWPKDGDSPLRAALTTHVLRWVVIDRLSDGVPARRRQQLERQCLLCTCVFDHDAERSVEGYLTRLMAQVPATAGIWGRCEGCPPGAGPEPMARWLAAHEIPAGFFFAPYGGATVAQVRDSLEWAQRMRTFAVDMQGESPEVLRAAFDERLRRAGEG
jgi:hypothetical protein